MSNQIEWGNENFRPGKPEAAKRLVTLSGVGLGAKDFDSFSAPPKIGR